MTTSGGDILTTILSGCDNGGDEEHKLKKKTDEKGFGRTYNNLINLAKSTIPDRIIFYKQSDQACKWK